MLRGVTEAVDLGDSYRVGDREIGLLRVPGEIMVEFTDADAKARMLDPQLKDGELLAGFQAIEGPKSNRVHLMSSQDLNLKDTEALLQQLNADADVSWAVPVFRNSESGLRQIITDEIIIDLADGASLEDVDADLVGEVIDYRRLRGLEDESILKLAAAGPELLEMSRQLWALSALDWAEPNFTSEVRPASTDPLFPEQWHLNNTGQSGGIADSDIDAVEAWNDTEPSEDVVIAIWDTGIQDHPDLNLWVNPGEIPDNQLDDDGNGWVDDIHGWNFVLDNNDVSPVGVPGQSGVGVEAHGTPVAGIAAAKGFNGLGGRGVSYGSQVMALKIFDGSADSPLADESGMAEAVRYATGLKNGVSGLWNSADVLNISWSFSESNAFNAALYGAWDFGRFAKGLPVFASSGNRASNYTTRIPLEEQLTAGHTYSWVLEYRKNGSVSQVEDLFRLGELRNSDGNIYRINEEKVTDLEAIGWDLNPFPGVDDFGWRVEDDPGKGFSTGRYQLVSDVISHNQSAWLMAPPFTSAAGTIESPTFFLWSSAEFSDKLHFHLYDHDTSSLIMDVSPSMHGENKPISTDVDYPANNPFVIAVGASSDFDFRSHYSRWGEELDLVASTGADVNEDFFTSPWTTDLLDTDGFNDAPSTEGGDYTQFTGTSAASPAAAGVAALLLGKNPNLYEFQIRSILQSTADKIGGVAYDSSGKSPYFGYGRLNAAAALQSISGPAATPILLESGPLDLFRLSTVGDLDQDGDVDGFDVGLAQLRMAETT